MPKKTLSTNGRALVATSKSLPPINAAAVASLSAAELGIDMNAKLPSKIVNPREMVRYFDQSMVRGQRVGTSRGGKRLIRSRIAVIVFTMPVRASVH